MKGETKKGRDEERGREERKNKKEGRESEKEVNVQSRWISLEVSVERVVRAYLYRRVDQ